MYVCVNVLVDGNEHLPKNDQKMLNAKGKILLLIFVFFFFAPTTLSLKLNGTLVVVNGENAVNGTVGFRTLKL